ncbi:MAG: DNA recombination protein RmuC [Deltaproteobacteria bacterium]|nr:DNA recombination protein RmuC [Deltaproteobacteria bacterium]
MSLLIVSILLSGLVLVTLLGILFRRRDPTSLLLKQEIDHLRQTQESNSKQVSDQLGKLTGEIGLRLEESLKHFREANKHVGDRLDNAARVVGEVQNRLGKLEVATEQIHAVGRDIATLQESLRSPKFRGGFGEFTLETILSQILPGEFFTLQYRYKSGEIVDAVIQTKEGLIPVDSKFPLPNFKRIIEAPTDEEKKSARKDFVRDVRKHVDDIVKYIRPEEGTLPFALMYIPAENVYYETIIKEDEVGSEFLDYAQKKRVFPVSPNSFYAYLQTIAIGLRGMKIEEWAKTIDANLQSLKQDLGRFVEEFSQVGGHLKNLRLKYESAEKRLERFQDDLTTLEVPTENKKLLKTA